MVLTEGLTQELFGEGPEIRQRGREFLRESVKDDDATRYVARLLGNDTPRPARLAVYDPKLVGTGVLAWYLDPQEVKEVYPRHGRLLEQELGTEPVIAYNPDPVREYLKTGRGGKRIRSVAAHEKGHGGQPGKVKLKQLKVHTHFGPFPLGEALGEGHNEYALDRRYEEMTKKGIDVERAPTRDFEEHLRPGEPVPAYIHYRELVYELEHANPGIMRQVFRAAHRATLGDVVRLLNTVPDVGKIVNKYAGKIAESYMRN